MADKSTGPDGMITPPALEYSLLRRLPRSTPAEGGGIETKTTTTQPNTNGVAEDERMGVGYCSKWGSTIAVCDLQGQTAPEPDWYHPISFVCMHCLQPAQGLAIGNPIGAEKTVDHNGRTTWVVRGRFGSVGCALRYASDNRYTFSQETSGMLPIMLLRAYGFKGDLGEIPIAPARTELPPFQPILAKKWAAKEIQFDGLSFHEKLNQNVLLHPPDPLKHLIVSDHCALLVDAQTAREKLDITAKQLKQALPNLYIAPRSVSASTNPLPK